MTPSIRDEESLPEDYAQEIRAAATRAVKCGARSPLEFMGIGMTGVVFCDVRGVGYKVCRHPESPSSRRGIEEEAEWLSVASTVSQIRDLVARFRAYHPAHVVIERECVRTQRPGRRPADTRWERMQQIKVAMRPYGFGIPEFKEDSFVYAQGRGYVLVDASMPIRMGSRLVGQAVAHLRGRDTGERAEDIAFALRMEAGQTVSSPRALRLAARLLAPPPSRRR
ncbi:MAG: hypothetical protein ACHREM_25410 [Polyangiales bacterium]